jgi:hypothetical protein
MDQPRRPGRDLFVALALCALGLLFLIIIGRMFLHLPW